ncbi:MAG: RNA methyltransferase [Bacteroidales bacterium]|nr:RNA methyltransferase [Bacteroidales bacterium]
MTPKDKAFLDFLSQFITDERNQRFDEVLVNRTRHITVVLEDIFQPHNASAVLRSCDLTGVQDIHVIENNFSFDINPDVVMGSTKWLDVHRYNELEFNTPTVIDTLKEKGYQIVATCPRRDDYTPESLPLDQPVALFFGTEKTGLTDYVLEHADKYVQIPMVGFTESFNISVSAALLVYTLTRRLHQMDLDWHLSEEEKQEVRLEWSRRTLNRIRHYERRFLELHPEYS